MCIRDRVVCCVFGSIGVWLALGLLSRKTKEITWGRLCSLAGLFAPIGLMLGRISNFLNGEIVGKPTSGSWGVVFENIDSIPRHPVQLYEAFLEGPVLFIYLLFHRSHSKNAWHCTQHFVYGYSALRIIAEHFKESPTFWILSAGQWYCILVALAMFAMQHFLKKR